jgi:hypothetical protein
VRLRAPPFPRILGVRARIPGLQGVRAILVAVQRRKNLSLRVLLLSGVHLHLTPISSTEGKACGDGGRKSIPCRGSIRRPVSLGECGAKSDLHPILTTAIPARTTRATSDACDSQTGSCQHQPLVDDPCSDNDLCTDDDRCDAVGACSGDGVDPNDANPCTAASCDSATGIAHEPVDPWTPCSDGDPSNGTEMCDASAVCVSLPQSESVVGVSPDVDEHSATRRTRAMRLLTH